jgi:uncharacterized protein
MRNWIKKVLLSLVSIVFVSAWGGAFDDFFIAVRNDNAGAVSDLLVRGFDPNSRDEKGQPGLTIAMREQSLKVARVLLAHPSIDLHALNQAGESALMMAALKGDLASSQVLLERGAKVNQPGWSPLHYAATGPEPKLVQLLLDRGAEIDAAAPNGSTPLMMAAQYGSEDSVKILLARGADPKRQNQRGQSAVDFARLSGREFIVKRLDAAQR